MMDAVRLSGVVNEDHKLIVTVPDTVPVGPVELLIQLPDSGKTTSNPERETARAKLAAAGLLSAAHRLPLGTPLPTDAEVEAAGILPQAARPSEELIHEDRDEA